uniref:Reverse transcriptase domain-containing protein n=1 Tax=Tanacetum cinerariifolium TaxID=118510 RepID=A0A6L2LPV0_TANCI|nr:reverse transcriptase domain-containing protein [Tanacetum cinerariifolium]
MNTSQEIKMQMVDDNVGNQARQNAVQNSAARDEDNATGNNGNPIRFYNCRGEGHYASNYTVKPRKRDAAYLQQQLQISLEKEAGIQSTQEEFKFMAAADAYEETKRVKVNCTSEDTLQQVSTSGTQSDNALYPLQIKLERTKEKLENCIIKKEKEYAVLWNKWYTKCEECKYDKILYDKAYNDMQQKIKLLQAQLGDQTITSSVERSNGRGVVKAGSVSKNGNDFSADQERKRFSDASFPARVCISPKVLGDLVQNSCQFYGLLGDDANKHLDKFLHVTQSIKVNGVTYDALRLYLFPHSLTHHATAWFDRLPRNSITTFEQMAKIFFGKYFPPSMVAKLRNEITNFCQHPDESLFKAWERYKLLIDRCPNHNMLPITQIDTFYNGLTLRHRDTINAAAGGTFMKRRPEECYDLIENMTAHHNDWDTSVQRSESSSSITFSSDPEIIALKDEMEEINKNLMNSDKPTSKNSYS